jgi:protoporphyrinogen oxidase
MLRLSGSSRAGASAKGQGRVFHYPRRGFGQIVEALATAATEAGASIRLGVAADHLVAGGQDVTIATTRQETFQAGQVFSTIPLPVLGRIAQPRPDAALEAAGRLRFRAMVLVYVVHGGGRYSPYDAHYLPGPETPVTRISEPPNYRVSDDDPVDRSVLCAELPCSVGDPIWTASESDLAAIVDDTLMAAGLPRPERCGVEVRRLPHVYPVYEMGYEQHLAELDAWALGLPRVTTFGRLGTFAHDNTHHAIAMAYDAVDALSAAGFDDTAWSAARDRFAAHVVED